MFKIDLSCNWFDVQEFDKCWEDDYKKLCEHVSNWCTTRQIRNSEDLSRAKDTIENISNLQDTVDLSIYTDEGHFLILRNTDELISCQALKEFLSLDIRLKEMICDISQLQIRANQVEEIINTLYSVITEKMHIF